MQGENKRTGNIRRPYGATLLMVFIVISVIFRSDMCIWRVTAETAPIERKYVNSQFGFEIVFPFGWSILPSYLDDNRTLFVNLVRNSNRPELGANDLSSMSLSAGKNLSSLNLRIKQNSLYENCNLSEKYYQTIDNKNFTASVIKCPTIYYKIYHFQNPALTLNYTYTTLPSAFEFNLDDFEMSVKTIKIR